MKTNAKKSAAQDNDVRFSENEVVKVLNPELSPAEKVFARIEKQRQKLIELEKKADLAKERAIKQQAEFDEKQAKAEQKAKERQEKLDKIAAEKAEKKANRSESPTPWGSTIEILCKNPDLKFDALLEELKAKGVDVIKSKSTIHTTYSNTRRVVTLLRENGLMAKAS